MSQKTSLKSVLRYARFHGIRQTFQRGLEELNNRYAISVSTPSERYLRHPGGMVREAGRFRVLICAHVASKLHFGAERSFFDMIDGLNAMGAEVFAAVPKGTAAGYIGELRQRTAAVFVLPYVWWRADRREDEAVIADFASIIARERISAVHANTIMLREPLTAARRMGVAAIIHVRELARWDAALCESIGLPAEQIEAEIAARADLLIANSQFTAQALGQLPQVPVALVHNTVDFASLSTLPLRAPDGVLRVGMISSNLPKKGLEAVASLARMLREEPRIRFCLVGPENPHTAALAGTVDVLGYRDTPAQALAELDVVLSLSEFTESFGRTVLEAQASGRPAIVWDRGAPPEIVLDGQSGHVIAPGDLDAAARAILRLADEPARYAEMSRRARQQASDRFGPQTYKDQMEKAYQPILEGFRPARLTLPARVDTAPRTAAETRIAYFVWHFPVRSETFVLNELRLLRQQGYDVTVFCRESPQPDFKPDFDIQWERVADSDRLARRLVETGRTICHSHFVFPTVTNMLWPACEQAGIPFTFIAHAQDIFRYANDEKNRVGEIAKSPLCRKVFVPSNFHRSYLQERGVPSDKMVLNPNGCDYRNYAGGWARDRASRPFRRISAVHRFTEKKGLRHLIRAAKYLEDTDLRITIHGYGDDEKDYRDIIRKEQIRNVDILGPVKGLEEMLEIFRTSDLFACPSVRAADGDMDGIPTVLIEAMAAGLPVLTTPLSGIPDLVADGVTGLLTAPDPVRIAARIREFYALPDETVDGMIEAGAQHVRTNFNSEYLVDILLRVWTNNRLDLMIVSWNGPAELAEVIRRLRKNTSMPYHLIVCDNGSDLDTLSLLQSAYAENDQMTLILNRENAFVGPGTNICLAQGKGEYAIYVCGKEGMTTGWGWEKSFIETLRANSNLGLVGSIGHSPSYLFGRDYPGNIPVFGKFRNQDFASENPDRVFGHVQGGFFGIRRAMYESIGGFSTDVPHNHTDVEYSFYAESCGWELGTVPGLMALYNKTRPVLAQRVDEHHLALHPPTLNELAMFDSIARCEGHHCNLCGRSSPRFRKEGADEICTNCGSDRLARSLFRALAESTLLYRRQLALGVDLPPSLVPFWKEQFQGKIMSSDELRHRGSGVSDGRLDLVGLARGPGPDRQLAEAVRVLAPGGTLILCQTASDPALERRLEELGLVQAAQKRYTSRVLEFHPSPILIYRRNATKPAPKMKAK